MNCGGAHSAASTACPVFRKKAEETKRRFFGANQIGSKPVTQPPQQEQLQNVQMVDMRSSRNEWPAPSSNPRASASGTAEPVFTMTYTALMGLLEGIASMVLTAVREPEEAPQRVQQIVTNLSTSLLQPKDSQVVVRQPVRSGTPLDPEISKNRMSLMDGQKRTRATDAGDSDEEERLREAKMSKTGSAGKTPGRALAVPNPSLKGDAAMAEATIPPGSQ